jgi:hypothetical protein
MIETDANSDNETSSLDKTRKQQRVSCSDLEREMFKTLLANEVIMTYLMYWFTVRQHKVPKWFRDQYDDGARDPNDFETPAAPINNAQCRENQ